jgi:hypothetical protein
LPVKRWIGMDTDSREVGRAQQVLPGGVGRATGQADRATGGRRLSRDRRRRRRSDRCLCPRGHLTGATGAKEYKSECDETQGRSCHIGLTSLARLWFRPAHRNGAQRRSAQERLHTARHDTADVSKQSRQT